MFYGQIGEFLMAKLGKTRGQTVHFYGSSALLV
jgi:hypothetical protein